MGISHICMQILCRYVPGYVASKILPNCHSNEILYLLATPKFCVSGDMLSVSYYFCATTDLHTYMVNAYQTKANIYFFVMHVNSAFGNFLNIDYTRSVNITFIGGTHRLEPSGPL